MLIVDAHLDLSYNFVRGRDPRMPARQQPAMDGEIATVGFPDLRAGGVGLICATIFCIPGSFRPEGYKSADEARAQSLSQLTWYQSCIEQGLFRFVRKPQDIPRDCSPALNAILLMEGGDAFRSPDDVQEWFDNGLRIVGLAWRGTRMAGGTGEPGPLTDEGRALVKELDRVGIIHDASHLAEESFWQLLGMSDRPVIASHSNCRAIVEGDRHLSDDMIRAIGKRGGVVGINFFDKFLIPKAEQGKRRATLEDVVAHIKHICELTGSADHVGLGTDMDGGLGREQIPVEVETSADLPRVGQKLLSAGFSPADVAKVQGANWLRFFASHL